MGISIVAAAAVFFVVAGTLLYLIIIYNGLVRLRNDSNRAWANIDVLLNLQHERQTLVAVTQARAASISAASIGQKAQANLMLTGALRGLFAVAENYPRLKANENFLRLQNRISELEERIADRREFFNDDVNAYNTRIRQVPEVFLANLMALKPRELFTVSDEDRKLVEVGLTKELGTA